MKNLLAFLLLISIFLFTNCKKDNETECDGQVLSVVNPQGGESLKKGSTVTIKWDYCGITSDVEVRFDYPGSSNQVGIVDISKKEFTVTIPTNFPARNDWQIALTALGGKTGGGNIDAWSKAFSIVN